MTLSQKIAAALDDPELVIDEEMNVGDARKAREELDGEQADHNDGRAYQHENKRPRGAASRALRRFDCGTEVCQFTALETKSSELSYAGVLP